MIKFILNGTIYGNINKYSIVCLFFFFANKQKIITTYIKFNFIYIPTIYIILVY